MFVERSTWLAASPHQCIVHVLTPRLLCYVSTPLVRFTPVDPPDWPDHWDEQPYKVTVRLLGWIPFGQQTINISIPAQHNQYLELRDNGYSSIISTWDHLITITAHGTGTLYTDRVEIKAGLMTPLVWVWGWVFYRHRQRRWQHLVASNFAY